MFNESIYITAFCIGISEVLFSHKYQKELQFFIYKLWRICWHVYTPLSWLKLEQSWAVWTIENKFNLLVITQYQVILD